MLSKFFCVESGRCLECDAKDGSGNGYNMLFKRLLDRHGGYAGNRGI